MITGLKTNKSQTSISKMFFRNIDPTRKLCAVPPLRVTVAAIIKYLMITRYYYLEN